jgi:hypothetical protein
MTCTTLFSKSRNNSCKKSKTTDIERLAKATGAKIINRLKDVTNKDFRNCRKRL